MSRGRAIAAGVVGLGVGLGFYGAAEFAEGDSHLRQAEACYHALQGAALREVAVDTVIRDCPEDFNGIPRDRLTISLPDNAGGFVMMPTPEGYKSYEFPRARGSDHRERQGMAAGAIMLGGTFSTVILFAGRPRRI